MKHSKYLWLFSIPVIILSFITCSDENEKEEPLPPPKPEITIVEPSEGALLEAGQPIDIRVTISSSDEIRIVNFFINNESKGYLEEAPYNFKWDATDMEEYPPGTYTLTVKTETQTDATNSASITFKLVTPTHDVRFHGTIRDRKNNTLLEGIEVVLNDISSTTGQQGEFLLETALAIGSYSIKTNPPQDYLPFRYGFDLNTPLDEELDLYAYPKPENVTTKPSGFIRGVSLFDAGPWMAQDLFPEEFSSTFERLETVNANLVTVFDPVFVTVAGLDSVKMSSSANTSYQWDMLTTNQYESLTDQATNHHLDFMWWFGVWPHDEEMLDGKRFNEIVFSGAPLSDKFWEDWFSEYTKYLKEYATVAQSKGVKYISLGHGLNYATSPAQFSSPQLYNTLWRNLIADIRSVYDGQLVYFGAHRPFETKNYSGGEENEYYEDAGYSDEFKNLFDAFGIILSNITQTIDPDVNTLKSATLDILKRYSNFPKPIILWIWAPSADGAANHYGHLEPVLDVDVMAHNYKQDFYEQADIYEGILEAVNETNTNVKGVISHGYMYFNRFDKYEPRDMNTAFEKSASVRGKPAEDILTFWFDQW